MTCGGLASQLVGISVGAVIAEECRRVYFVILGKGLNHFVCDYYSLFQRIDNTHVIESEDLLPPLIHGELSKHNFVAMRCPTIFCMTCYWSGRCKKAVKILQNIQYSDYVKEKVADFTSHHDLSQCIGVHVRRGDLRVVYESKMAAVPVDEYFTHLASHYPEHPLYITSDSETVRREFQEKYGDKVISYRPRTLSRNNDEGVQDAMVEMLLLSKCQEIVGGWSGFAQVASMIGNKPWKMLNSSHWSEVDDW